MHVSLNEVESLGRRAGRGAGFAWGLAEEAGKAWRWLEGHGIDAAVPYADLLDEVAAGRAGSPLEPRPGVVWRARTGRLCPIAAGTALIDRAGPEFVEAGILLGSTLVPLFLVPFAASVARGLGSAVVLEWPGVCWTLGSGGAWCAGERQSLVMSSAPEARLARAADRARGDRVVARLDGAVVDAAAWARLERFGARTYVPASEVSRLKGAGAGLLDTD